MKTIQTNEKVVVPLSYGLAFAMACCSKVAVNKEEAAPPPPLFDAEPGPTPAPATPTPVVVAPVRASRSALLILTLTAISLSVCIANKPKASDGAKTHSTTTVSDRTVKVTCDVPKQARVDLDIPLKLLASNSGLTDLMIGEVDDWPQMNCVITITDAQKEDFKPTKTGAAKAGRAAAPNMYRFELGRIKPGQQKTWTLNLQGLFPLKPGSYLITVNFTASKFPDDGIRPGVQNFWPPEEDTYSIKIADIPLTVATGEKR